MKNIKKWARNQIAAASIAFSNVEKNFLGQEKNDYSKNSTTEKRHTQGTLADSLVHGEITEEVMDLRHRINKILKATEGVTSEIIGYDEDGIPIVKTSTRDYSKNLDKILLDSFDDYKLEMVVDNSEITTSLNYMLFNKYVIDKEEPVDNLDEDGYLISTTIANIGNEEYFTINKAEKPITIVRDFVSNFNIEDYTKKLNVRKINDNERLLEFYTSKYPDEYNRTTRLFLSALKKAIINPRQANMLDIKEVEVITHKTIGAPDFLKFEYSDLKFDKIIEFNGHYVIKFIGIVKTNGEDITEIYKREELDKKYINKEAKN